MANVRIVTDATIYLSPDLISRHRITVLPLEIRFGSEKYLIRQGDSMEPLFRQMDRGPAHEIQATIPPQAVQEAYTQLNRETDEILVITSSRKLSGAHAIAVAEVQTFLGRCRINVVDSLTTSWGLGLVVEAAARAASEGLSLDEVVRLVRGVLPHIYGIFFVERLDYLEHGRRVGKAQALLGTMFQIKPLLIIEDGDIIPLEKVRTQVAAIEKLADFVAEFASIQKVVLMCSPLGNGAKALRSELDERLGEALPELEFPMIAYDAVLACHLGPEALGVAVFEGL
jgi:DegV family protein with EDD domain